MREILFRGQTRRCGEKVNLKGEKLPGIWVYGGVLQCKGDFSIIYGGDSPNDINKHTVYTDTLGQYTGLTDKHGNRIFEGDIVKTDKYGTGDGQGRNFEVAVEYGGFCLRDGWRRYNLRPDDGIEVIGNIYDNPELLGGEKGE